MVLSNMDLSNMEVGKRREVNKRMSLVSHIPKQNMEKQLFFSPTCDTDTIRMQRKRSVF